MSFVEEKRQKNLKMNKDMEKMKQRTLITKLLSLSIKFQFSVLY